MIECDLTRPNIFVTHFLFLSLISGLIMCCETFPFQLLYVSSESM